MDLAQAADTRCFQRKSTLLANDMTDYLLNKNIICLFSNNRLVVQLIILIKPQ